MGLSSSWVEGLHCSRFLWAPLHHPREAGHRWPGSGGGVVMCGRTMACRGNGRAQTRHTLCVWQHSKSIQWINKRSSQRPTPQSLGNRPGKLKNNSHQEARQKEPKCPDVGLTFTPIETKVQILRGESLLGQLWALRHQPFILCSQSVLTLVGWLWANYLLFLRPRFLL